MLEKLTHYFEIIITLLQAENKYYFKILPLKLFLYKG